MESHSVPSEASRSPLGFSDFVFLYARVYLVILPFRVI